MTTRRHSVMVTLGALLTCFGVPAAAESVYQWTDANGNKHYSDKPVPSATRVDPELLKSKPIPPKPPVLIPPSFRQSVASQCGDAKERLGLYEQSGEVIETTDTGVEYSLPENQRQRVLAELRGNRDKFCARGATERLWRQATAIPDKLTVPDEAERVPIAPSGF